MKPYNFRFIDLFCGIGGFHQAMTPLGGKCVFASDINEQCREVYKKNFAPNDEFVVYGDINKAIKEKVIPEFEVLCGGFPCQTFSKAGNQNGFEVVEKENGEKDERGQLFYRIIDILKEHPECKYVVLENVRNLADKKDNWEIICKELKEQGFIITEEPIIESPHNFGVPQVRERVFILGVRTEAFDGRKSLPKGYLTREILGIDEMLDKCSEKGNCLPGIIDKGVDSKYFVSEEIEHLLDAWEEFRANVNGLCNRELSCSLQNELQQESLMFIQLIKDLNLTISADNIIKIMKSDNDFAIIICLDIWKNHNKSVQRSKHEARLINEAIKELMSSLNGEKLSGARWLLLYELYVHKFVSNELLPELEINDFFKKMFELGVTFYRD